MKCLRLAQGEHRRTNMVYIETMGSTGTTKEVHELQIKCGSMKQLQEESTVSTKVVWSVRSMGSTN